MSKKQSPAKYLRPAEILTEYPDLKKIFETPNELGVFSRVLERLGLDVKRNRNHTKINANTFFYLVKMNEAVLNVKTDKQTLIST